MKNRQAVDVLNGDFLKIRAGIIAVAASLDRIDRAMGDATDDPRLENIGRALEILREEGPNRAESVQLAFSLPESEA